MWPRIFSSRMKSARIASRTRSILPAQRRTNRSFFTATMATFREAAGFPRGAVATVSIAHRSWQLLHSLTVKPAPVYQQPSPLPSDYAPGEAGPIPRRVIIAAVVLGLLTIALFAPTWKDQMLGWDDDENVLHNPLVVMPAAAGLKQIFTAPFSTDYYPLTYISLAIDHAVWRGHFFGYHVTQTLLHGANVFLVVLLVWRWTEMLGVALLAGAWFGWHPVQVETVAWIAERKSVLGAFLFLLAWLAYLKAGDSETGKRWRLVALGLFLLAVLTHALVIVMPALLIDYELCLRRTRFTEALRRTWLFFVPTVF